MYILTLATYQTTLLPDQVTVALSTLHQELVELTQILKNDQTQQIITHAKMMLEATKETTTKHGRLTKWHFMQWLSPAPSDDTLRDIQEEINEKLKSIRLTQTALQKLPQTADLKKLQNDLQEQKASILENLKFALKTTNYQESTDPLPFQHPPLSFSEFHKNFPLEI